MAHNAGSGAEAERVAWLSVTPSSTFDAACQRVIDHLRRDLPLAFWSVSRRVDGQQVHLYVHDEVYGTSHGHTYAWSDSFCQYVVDGVAPRIAADAMAVPEFASAPIAKVMGIGAYVGVPIHGADGTVFGTICGLDPHPHPRPERLHAYQPLLDVLAELLEQILRADHLRFEADAREAELRWNAHHDHLTRLANRAGFFHHLTRLHDTDLHNADLHDTDLPGTGRRRPTAVMLIDLDDFKAVNDTFGHAGGDQLLVLIADRLRDVLHPTDLLARLGGDEFAVIVDHDEPQAVGARVVQAMEQPFVVSGRRIRLSAAVGVAELATPRSSGDVDLLIARADIAMYQAKRDGKGRFVVFEPSMALPASTDLALGEPLQRAIATGTLQAWYQPIVTLPDRNVVGFEALARWTHRGVTVAPDLFIPVAARLGLLPTLTDHMLTAALGQLARWTTQLGHPDMHVGVNLSPLCMSDANLPDRVLACLERHQVDPRRVTLEITEEALLRDLPTATAVARRLRDIGVRLSLDDFGTGYSSLLHLRKIPLDSMKIDRGFLHDIDTNADTARFVKALLTFGADLGIVVVVEGVEREQQSETLIELGCNLAQGHLFGAAAPADSWDLTGP